MHTEIFKIEVYLFTCSFNKMKNAIEKAKVNITNKHKTFRTVFMTSRNMVTYKPKYLRGSMIRIRLM